MISRALEGYQRANFQVAIDAYLAHGDRDAELIGLPMMRGYRVGLAELVDDRTRGPWQSIGGDAGPIEYEPVDVGERRILCVAAGLWLITDGNRGMLLLLRREDHGPGHAELGIEVMARDRADAERLLSELDRLMTELNVYRGRILALSGSPFGGLGVEVRAYPRCCVSRSCSPMVCSSASSGIPRRSPSMLKRCEHPDGISSAGCSCMALREPARH